MLKIGIIGSGFGTIGLLPAFESTRGCTVVGQCAGRADWKTFLDTNNLDAIAIAVPPRVQYQIAKVAIKKGLHIFAEKPLAANLAQARKLFALAKKKRVVTGIDFIFPEIAEWKKVKESIDKKTFGALKNISVDWVWQSGDIQYGRDTWRTKVSEGGGALAFYFSHGLYYLESFAGRIQSAETIFIRSRKSLNGGEVGFNMLLRFKGGTTGNVRLSCNVPGTPRHILVFLCEKGAITLENANAVVDNFAVKIYDRNGEKIVKVKKDKGRKEEDERVKIVRELAKRFVDSCARKKQMVPSFSDGLRVQELIDKIRRTAKK
jgi:predicted dehydrogenase